MIEIEVSVIFMILLGISLLLMVIFHKASKTAKKNTLNKQACFRIPLSSMWGLCASSIICILIAPTSIQTQKQFIISIAVILITMSVVSYLSTSIYIRGMEVHAKNAKLLGYDTKSERYVGGFTILSVLMLFISLIAVSILGYFYLEKMIMVVILDVIVFLMISLLIADNIHRLNQVHQINEIYRNICDSYMYNENVPVMDPEILLQAMKELYQEMYQNQYNQNSNEEDE